MTLKAKLSGIYITKWLWKKINLVKWNSMAMAICLCIFAVSSKRTTIVVISLPFHRNYCYFMRFPFANCNLHLPTFFSTNHIHFWSFEVIANLSNWDRLSFFQMKASRKRENATHVHKVNGKQLSQKLLIKPFVVYRIHWCYRVNAVIGNYLETKKATKQLPQKHQWQRQNFLKT